MVTKTKRRASDDESDPVQTKHQRQQFPINSPVTVNENRKFIEAWLDHSSQPEEPLNDDEQVSEVLIDMPPKSQAALSLSKHSIEPSSAISNEPKKTTASIHDPDYHESLACRKIHIQDEDPPKEFMHQARQITTRDRTSPELDDETVERLRQTSRRLRTAPEDRVAEKLAPYIIPASQEDADPRLQSSKNQIWTRAVPIPMGPNILSTWLRLPNPKPDVSFGFSRAAFTDLQNDTIGLIVDCQHGHSYAVPDQELRFPFFNIEFKSQAKDGTHFKALNQLAGAGAVALNGILELMERSFGLESFDYDAPQFFSMSIDHESAYLYVHWTRALDKEGLHSFHVERLSHHLLDDLKGVRTLVRAIQNIFDYNLNTRLKLLRKALNVYRKIVQRDRKAANAQARRNRSEREEEEQHILHTGVRFARQESSHKPRAGRIS